MSYKTNGLTRQNDEPLTISLVCDSCGTELENVNDPQRFNSNTNTVRPVGWYFLDKCLPEAGTEMLYHLCSIACVIAKGQWIAYNDEA